MALIKCPECGKEISDNAQNCPQCGYPLKGSATKGEDNPSIGTAKGSQQTSQPVPKKKKNGCLVGCLTFFIIFAVLIFIISSIGGKSTKTSPDKSTKSNTEKSSETNVSETSIPETEAKKEDLEILSYENLNDGMLRYVTGQVKNNTDKNYSYVQIEIKMYKDDTVLGSTLDNMNNLGPGETWQFKAIITDNECNKYTIVGVTGF